MIRNVRGEMGFMESMLSMMAVVIVIGLYLVFVATSTASAYSPLDELDPEMITEKSPDGPVISDSYVYSFIFNKGLRGISVTISTPYFPNEESTAVGECTGAEYSKRFLILGEYGNGRTLPAILEVKAFI